MFGFGNFGRSPGGDALPAIWTLSCNDENPIMTYSGVADRVGVTEDEARKLVGARRELFRPGIPKTRLEDWKERMRSGRASLPSRIAEIPEGERRQQAIDTLSGNDVFRSQFRIEDGAPKCPVEILEWGLKYLETLRQSQVVAREERIKKLGTVTLPVVAILVSLAVALESQYLQWKLGSDQNELKRYEIGFKTKLESYATFMSAFNEAVAACSSANSEKAGAQINRMEAAYLTMAPFFAESERKSIDSKYAAFVQACNAQAQKPALVQPDGKIVDAAAHEKLTAEMGSFKQFFREGIFDAFFKKGSI